MTLGSISTVQANSPMDAVKMFALEINKPVEYVLNKFEYVLMTQETSYCPRYEGYPIISTKLIQKLIDSNYLYRSRQFTEKGISYSYFK